MKDIVTEEGRCVGKSEHTENGGAYVHLTCEAIGLSGRDESGRIDEEGNAIAFHRQIALSCGTCLMVGNDDKDRILKPRLLPCALDEIMDGPVRITDGTLARALFALYAPFRKVEGTVV